jgi:hypothetical protein
LARTHRQPHAKQKLTKCRTKLHVCSSTCRFLDTVPRVASWWRASAPLAVNRAGESTGNATLCVLRPVTAVADPRAALRCRYETERGAAWPGRPASPEVPFKERESKRT